MAEVEGLQQFREAVEQGLDQVEELLLDDHIEDLKATYEKNPGKLVVSLILRLAPSKKKGVIDVETRMSFVSERIKDSKKGTAGDPQASLEFEGDQGATGDLQDAQQQEAAAEKDLPGDTPAGEVVQPNDRGVFQVEPILGYHGGSKKKACEAFIRLVEYEDKWYQATTHVLQGASQGGGYPSLNGIAHDSIEEAFHEAKVELTSKCEDLIQWFPTRKVELKKMLAWVEGISMDDVDTAIAQTGSQDTQDEDLKQDGIGPYNDPMEPTFEYEGDRGNAYVTIFDSEEGKWYQATGIDLPGAKGYSTYAGKEDCYDTPELALEDAKAYMLKFLKDSMLTYPLSRTAGNKIAAWVEELVYQPENTLEEGQGS